MRKEELKQEISRINSVIEKYRGAASWGNTDAKYRLRVLRNKKKDLSAILKLINAGKEMEEIYCKDTQEAMEQIRQWLKDGKPIHVVNQYETVYGVGFDRWLKNGINDIPCKILESDASQWEYGYPWSYDIYPC